MLPYRPIEEPFSLFAKVIVSLFLAGLIVGVVYCIYYSPIGSLFAILALVVAFRFSVSNERIHFRRFFGNRTDTICEFSRSFDVSKVDPWILRAVYEAVHSYISYEGDSAPIRPSDRLVEDLLLDSENIVDIVLEVSERAGYSIDDWDENPHYEKVNTIEDLVVFVSHQQEIYLPNKWKQINL